MTRKLSARMAAAVLAALPAAAHAQSTPVEVVVDRSATVVVKEAPRPSPITFTPYGFALLNVYVNDALGSRNYPLPTACAGGASCDGNILLDVRQSRLGARLTFDDTAGWTGARLGALFEIDFQGGYAGQAVITTSAVFYSPLVRLRKAYADATWGTGSRFTIRLGQDDHQVSLLRPVSLAWVANPLFQFAGTLNGRAPMLALRYDLDSRDGIAFSAVAAALNPQDNTYGDAEISPGAAVDLGAGNRSGMPAFEGKIGVAWKRGGKTVVALNGWGGIQRNRLVNPATDTAVDLNTSIIGGDLTLNLPWVQVLGSIYKANGYDIPGSLNSQGVAISYDATTRTITGTKAVPALGGWFQVLVGPSDLFQAYGGWGGTQSPFSALEGSLLGPTNAAAANGVRVQNFTWATGLIAYAGRNWRFSAEYARSTSFFYSGNAYTQGQFSLNSQVVF